MLLHHANGTLTGLRRELVRLVHSSIFSEIGASFKIRGGSTLENFTNTAVIFSNSNPLQCVVILTNEVLKSVAYPSPNSVCRVIHCEMRQIARLILVRCLGLGGLKSEVQRGKSLR